MGFAKPSTEITQPLLEPLEMKIMSTYGGLNRTTAHLHPIKEDSNSATLVSEHSNSNLDEEDEYTDSDSKNSGSEEEDENNDSSAGLEPQSFSYAALDPQLFGYIEEKPTFSDIRRNFNLRFVLESLLEPLIVALLIGAAIVGGGAAGKLIFNNDFSYSIFFMGTIEFVTAIAMTLAIIMASTAVLAFMSKKYSYAYLLDFFNPNPDAITRFRNQVRQWVSAIFTAATFTSIFIYCLYVFSPSKIVDIFFQWSWDSILYLSLTALIVNIGSIFFSKNCFKIMDREIYKTLIAADSAAEEALIAAKYNGILTDLKEKKVIYSRQGISLLKKMLAAYPAFETQTIISVREIEEALSEKGLAEQCSVSGRRTSAGEETTLNDDQTKHNPCSDEDLFYIYRREDLFDTDLDEFDKNLFANLSLPPQAGPLSSISDEKQPIATKAASLFAPIIEEDEDLFADLYSPSQLEAIRRRPVSDQPPATTGGGLLVPIMKGANDDVFGEAITIQCSSSLFQPLTTSDPQAGETSDPQARETSKQPPL